MVVQMEIISKEMIKPSSPTPHHLRELKISFLDQTTVRMYIPFLLFYHDHTSDNSEKTRQLKESLSDTLTMYYPLAGRIHENTSINCNDDGAEFVEARVHARLADFIDDPDLEKLKELLPVDPLNENDGIVLSIQASFFDYGGIAIGVALSHKIGDAASQVGFIRAWAATCRGKTKMIVQPRFDAASHFPPRDLLWLHASPTVRHQPEKVVTRRLILNKEKLTELKAEIAAAPDSELKDPTRVEAATAFIWKHFIAIAAKKRSVALHGVNIRPRMTPPLPEQTFGNCILISPLINDHDSAISENDGKEKQEIHHLAYQMRKTMRKIDGDYVKEVQDNGERYYLNFANSLREIMINEMRLCSFTSWCRFPVYEADYGWGKPVWVCTTPLSIKNLVVFMSTPCGEGIEAWVNLLEDDMKLFGIK